jgi:alkanesulfonate monooxygenase SsuD/methylene tetrahydromethanopterin reductase-like flavin-dependent oxidoreductase (luciferase family)
VRRAARLADGLFANAPVEAFLQQVRWVLDECERIGRDPASLRFIHYSILLPGATQAEALARYRDAVWAMQWKYSDMAASSRRPLPPPSPPPYARPDEALLKGRSTYAGPAERLVEALLDIRQRAGVPVELVARSYLPSLDVGVQLELMQQLAEEVAPHV